jgi:transcriptional regulator with XRE-family HTH domain
MTFRWSLSMPEAKRTSDDDTFAKALGKAIRMARQQADVKATELADKIGVTQQSVSTWETGVHLPSLVVLRKVAWATNTPLWKIMRAADQLYHVALAREAQKGASNVADTRSA